MRTFDAFAEFKEYGKLLDYIITQAYSYVQHKLNANVAAEAH